MEKKQQQLLFDKGITNVPSDVICSDNALHESVGMIYDDGEHRVIQNPVTYMTGAEQLKYVHTYGDSKRYILAEYRTGPRGQSGTGLKWGTRNNNDKTFVYGGDLDVIGDPNKIQITSIGKTLVVTTGENIKYFLWKGQSYEDLGEIPEPEFDFWFKVRYTGPSSLPTCYFVENSQNSGDIIGVEIWALSRNRYVKEGQQNAFNDLVTGVYAKNKKAIAQAKGFCEPFFVRYALELYDGSYTYISNPILMMPFCDKNTWAHDDEHGIIMNTQYAKMFFTQGKSFNEWSDIVHDVVIFISDSAGLYDLSVDQKIKNENITLTSIGHAESDPYKDRSIARPYQVIRTEGNARNPYDVLVQKSTEELKKDIEGISVFYKLCGVGLNPVTTATDIGTRFQEHDLENLTTMEYLENDDYYSRCKLFPEFIYSYNSRLNMANVSRSFFEGFENFIAFDNTSASVYDIYVTIKADSGNVVIKHTTKSTYQKMDYFFYYPDSRATNVVIKRGNTTVLDAKLTEHTGLNGARYFRGIPGAEDGLPSDGGSTSVTTDPVEQLPNYIITSEVNNPWVYKAEGYNKVGTGKIIGMSTLTQALSEGQFGQYPLLVFSESGIWAMSVNSTGLFQSIHPMSREVCNNVKSITQTDGAVYFTSDKGLMVVVGSEVRCVSEQLSGRETYFNGVIGMGNFHDYLKTCHMAYDYRDSLLWIFNQYTVGHGPHYCYVYSMKSGTFGKYYFTDTVISSAVNDYPDTLLQAGSTLLSLIDRPNINADTGTYTGLMITRPLKLENSLALKSIIQIKNIRYMQGTLGLRIFGSNNLTNWFELSSLRGAPWKYFRFRFDFADMKATDRFAGSVLITQERRTDKLR